MVKFIIISSQSAWNANKDKVLNTSGEYYEGIVFRKDTNEIYTHGETYGLSAAQASKITNLETAVEALKKSDVKVGTDEKVISVTNANGVRTLASTLSLVYDKQTSNPVIKLVGKDSKVISTIDVSDFIKDRMISSATLVTAAESGITNIAVPYIKMTFNDETISPIRFSVNSLVDKYDASNIKLTSSFTKPSSYTASNIKANANLNTVVGELAKGVDKAIADAATASTSGVTSFGGATGAIALKAKATSNGSVNLEVSNKTLSASIVGLGSAAYTNSSAYATAAQGSTADSALGKVTALTEIVNTNKSSIVGLKGDIGTHSSAISTINTNIAGLRADIDSISGGTLNWVVLE